VSLQALLKPVSQVRILPGALVFAQVSDGFQMSADWSRLVLVGAVVGDWLAPDGAAWPAIVNRAASTADEHASVFHQQLQCSGSVGDAQN
jgi:hypothetical protein